MEVTWGITRVHPDRYRYIFNRYYKDKKISRELYVYLLKEGYADVNLIAKWRKVCCPFLSHRFSFTHSHCTPHHTQQGYERLCCLQCIQKGSSNYGTTCICRVPKDSLPDGKVVECVNCGCHGCASCD